MKILLIEPDRLLGQTYEQALIEDGHTVLLSRTAEEAIEMSNDTEIDVVVAEMLLGGHGGVEFLYEFRSYADWQETPIIIHSLLTPSEVQSYQRVLRELNVELYLYKPHTKLAQLKRAVLSVDPVIAAA